MADYNAEELATVQEEDATPDAAPAEAITGFATTAPVVVVALGQPGIQIVPG